MSEAFDTDTGEVLPLPEYRPLYPPIYRRSDEVSELFSALAKAQGAIEAAPRSGANPHFGSRYSTLDAVIEVSRKPLADNGLAIMQIPTSANDNISVTTLLSHASGQWFESTLSVKPVRWDAQGIGSAITYLRRYTRMSIIGIAPEDDDAEAAVGRPATPPARATRPTQPVSRANPAVAPDDHERVLARAAYRKVQAYIDGAKTSESIGEIFDPETGEWTGVFAQEIGVIGNIAPDSLSLLRERLNKRLERIANADPFGLARAPAETPSEPGGFPTPDSDPPPAAAPSTAPAEGTALLYPERAESGASQRRAPRARTERAND